MNPFRSNSKTIAKSFLQLQESSQVRIHVRCMSVLSVHQVPKIADHRKTELRHPQTAAFPEKCAQVFTCGKLFEKWRKERRHWYVHKGDVSFDIRYVDTGYKTESTGEISTDQPVVVALHGSPGSYENFSYMTSFIHNHGARVIAPNFPDLLAREKREFRHSSEEKRELIKDFLTTINVPRVDMLMCHSSALFPGLLMCLENQRPVINSLCLINPTAFDYPRSLKPLWIITLLSHMFEFPVGKTLASMGANAFVSSKKNLKAGCTLDHMLSGFTLVSSNAPQGAHHFQDVLDRNLPVLLAFSENDKLIHKKSLYKMAHMMIDESEVRKYNKDGELETRGGSHPTRKVLAFENGTHFLFFKYPQILSENVTTFLFQNFQSRRNQQCDLVK